MTSALMASPDHAPLDAFEEEVVRLRDAAFALSDTARDLLGHRHTGIHVHLQAAANELGELERLLADARA